MTSPQRGGRPTRLIVAGGRDYHPHPGELRRLDDVVLLCGITELVNGGAYGVDAHAHAWWLEVVPALLDGKWPFKADPTVYAYPKGLGRAGGPIRNRQMAEYAGPTGICVLFKGGRGTTSMHTEARKVGMTIYDWRDTPAGWTKPTQR